MRPAPLYVGRIAGTNFHKVSRNMKVGDYLVLRADPDNPHDPRAIAVDSKGGQVGYIQRKHTGRFHQLVDEDKWVLTDLVCVCGPSWDHITVRLP